MSRTSTHNCFAKKKLGMSKFQKSRIVLETKKKYEEYVHQKYVRSIHQDLLLWFFESEIYTVGILANTKFSLCF